MPASDSDSYVFGPDDVGPTGAVPSESIAGATGSEKTGAEAGSGASAESVGGYDLDDRSATGQVAFAYVSDVGITVEWCAENVASDEAGAVVTFSGVVRNHDHGKPVTRLSYSAHPSAGEVMREVANDVASAHPGTRIAVAHRVGNLAIGDIALACAVSAAHRSEAFAACSELVDAVKDRVPIWKEQWFTDGTFEWVGAG
ncbi:molybdopterin synthase catalytic subunit [Subtercola frigoramans]|uniref:Molybdopterin synthase catalytic subunit n=1 Tax=Subtercola frigoramans TaxID=120298 RepID=A0ABS2L717_9MICO|nr:molybdopterin synthase catalytic subunit [Subtercola frigoramans]